MKKFAVVTGASSGIGLEFTKLLASDHYDLLLAARDKANLKNLAEELTKDHGIKVDYLAIDLSLIGSADRLWAEVKNRPVDVFVNNAGFGDLNPLVSADWEKLSSMISLNVTALTRLSQLAATSMKKAKSGKILNVASIVSFFPGPGMATYYATKAYVLSLSESLSEELKNTGVTVTALCPGPTKTNFSEAASATNSQLFSGNIPTGKEVAHYGYKAMLNGKTVAVYGVGNKLKALLMPKVLPRFVVRKIINRIQNS